MCLACETSVDPLSVLGQVKKFMVGFEMLAQVQRDLTAEQVGP